MLIYVAGPYRAYGSFSVADNIQNAREVAIAIWQAGHTAICPHLNALNFEEDSGLPDEVFLERDLEILARCDAIVMAPRWEYSHGAIAEREYAIRHGIPCFVYPEMPNAEPGILIVFEGGDGVGKSTQAQKLYDYVRSLGKNAILTRQPGGTGVGEQIRNILLNGGDLSPEAEFYLFCADRVEHINRVIAPALNEGKVVVCDRWTYSTLVYQCMLGKFDRWQFESVTRQILCGIKPNITFILDADAAIASNRTKGDRLDSKGAEFHNSVRAAYRKILDLRKDSTLVGIDASGSPDEVFEQIRSRFDLLISESIPCLNC